MTNLRERATPTIKDHRHAKQCSIQSVDDALEQAAPVQMPGHRPFPLERQRFPGRGAGIQRVEDVLALQRTVGNRATQRALAAGQARRGHAPAGRSVGQPTRPVGTSTAIQRIKFRRKKNKQPKEVPILTGAERQQILDVRVRAQTPYQRNWKGPDKDRAGQAKEGLEYGQKVFQTPSDAFRGYSVAAVKGHEDNDEEYYASSPENASAVGSASERAGLSSGAYGAGSGASLFAMGGSIATIAKLSKKLKDPKTTGKKKTGVQLEMGARGMQAGASGGQVLTGIGTSIAKGVVSGDSDNTAAVDAATFMGGVGNALAAVGSVFEMLVAGAKSVIGLIKVVRGKAEDKKAAWAKILENFLSAGKNFLATASSATFATSKFLTYLEKGAAFVQHVPVIGHAIDIAVQALDILEQGKKFVTQVIRLVRAKKYRARMKQMATSTAKAAEQSLANYIGEANRKRFRRGIITVAATVINVLSDLVHIGGDIANIVGAATAGAMGAGGGAMAAGYGMKAGAGMAKLGAATFKPLAWATRHGKQKFRDAGKKHSSVYSFGKKLGIDMDKTSKNKKIELDKQAGQFLTYIKTLKDDTALSPLTDAEKKEELEKFTHAKNMIKGAGLSPKELLKAEDEVQMKDMVKEALKARD